MGRIETNGYYALGVPFYLAIVALEVYLARRQGRRLYGFANTIGNFSAGLGEIIIGLFLGPFLLWLYDFAYARMALVHWPDGSIVPWILAFALGDFCYYWYHRAGHLVAAFWAIHGVHHQSDKFNVGIATRHPWFSDTYSFVFYAPVPMLGVPPFHFFVAISIISFYALTVHSQVFHRPGLWFLVTPATHIVHHAKNQPYVNKNFGAMFTLWDRMFGTHVEVDPANPPVLGSSFGYSTHDGARAQFVFFGDLLSVASRASTFRDKLATFFRHPGWVPAGMTFPKHEAPRSDEAIPNGTKLYAASMFGVMLAFSLWILWYREHHPFWLLACGSAAILWSLSTLGGLLDGRQYAGRWEAARVVCTTALLVAIVATRLS